MDNKQNKVSSQYDSLRGWRESVTKYAGDSEYDATAEAIRYYNEHPEEVNNVSSNKASLIKNLQNAGILDKNGNVVEAYKDVITKKEDEMTF